MGELFITGRNGNFTDTYIPKFSYTGEYIMLDDGNRNWRLKLLTSGQLQIYKQITIDAFMVGGGGGSGYTASNGSDGMAGGAGGGYTRTIKNIIIDPLEVYDIVIGAGGAPRENGNNTTCFNYICAGGERNKGYGNGHGGCGGGMGAASNGGPGAGGSDGSDGYQNTTLGGGSAGKGQINRPGPNGETGSTREFGEPTGDLYAGGGGAIKGPGGAGGGGNGTTYGGRTDGLANTGGGAGGDVNKSGRSGGSGIVIIRNHRS